MTAVFVLALTTFQTWTCPHIGAPEISLIVIGKKINKMAASKKPKLSKPPIWGREAAPNG